MIYHKKKYKAWEVLKTYHENKFKYNSDFTYKINDRFTIEVNLLTSNDDSVILRSNLIQYDGFVLYNVDMIPADDIWQVVNGFEYIAYHINSKIITAVDRELQEHDGFIDCGYEWFMSHLSRVTYKHKKIF